MSPPLECAAPAKINLALHITGRRSDGYHLIESLVVFARVGDCLWAEPATEDSFSVIGPFAGQLCEPEGNLVLKARDLLRRHFGAPAQKPVALRLQKNLPVASGIGGGSSDAAAALGLLARYWGISSDAEDLARIGLELGADVPMCLAGRPIVARGIGEALEPAVSMPSLPLLLVNPGRPLETRAVFAALLRRDNDGLPPFGRCQGPAEAARWLHATRNDLEAPALSLLPEIGAVLGLLKSRGALLSRMSGSGATCFGIFEDIEAAERAGAEIARERPGWFVRATTTAAVSPEPGHV